VQSVIERSTDHFDYKILIVRVRVVSLMGRIQIYELV